MIMTVIRFIYGTNCRAERQSVVHSASYVRDFTATVNYAAYAVLRVAPVT